MLNQSILVGKLENDPEIVSNNAEGTSLIIRVTLGVTRSFKNNKGEYVTDILPVTMFNGIAHNVLSHCNKGSIVGIKGRINNHKEELSIVAEKVTFIKL